MFFRWSTNLGYAAEKMWAAYSGYLMLGSATALSAVIIFWLVRGVMRERAKAA
jgi:hypothetical protein